MKNETTRGWDVAAWIAASHLAVFAGSLLVLALVRHGGLQTVVFYFAIGAVVATPLAFLARMIWRRATRAGLPVLLRIGVLAGGGAALGIPGLLVSAGILAIAGEDLTFANILIGGLVFGAAAFWCGGLIGPFRELLGRRATVAVLAVSTAVTILALLLAVLAPQGP